ncbi:alpha/beta fold hydrolase [Candidatus Dojkabacteria bacterium]|nr:alpha/beta fold hydrolase [Candidatus Dojkabacteria bacterium]
MFSKFIDSLELNSVTLVGHSFGGGIALNLAPINDRVSKLILIDSAGLSPNYFDSKFVYLLTLKTVRSFFLSRNKLLSLLILGDFLREVFKKFFSIPKVWNIVRKSIFHDAKTFEKIKQPTYIFWGNSDEIFSSQLAHKMAQLIGNSTLKFIDGNHDWLLLMPHDFYELVSEVV